MPRIVRTETRPSCRELDDEWLHGIILLEFMQVTPTNQRSVRASALSAHGTVASRVKARDNNTRHTRGSRHSRSGELGGASAGSSLPSPLGGSRMDVGGLPGAGVILPVLAVSSTGDARPL